MPEVLRSRPGCVARSEPAGLHRRLSLRSFAPVGAMDPDAEVIRSAHAAAYLHRALNAPSQLLSRSWRSGRLRSSEAHDFCTQEASDTRKSITSGPSPWERHTRGDERHADNITHGSPVRCR